MKKTMFILLTLVLFCIIPALGEGVLEQETIFQRSYNDGNIPDWFGDNDFRGLAHYDGIIYICDQESNGIVKIDAQTGNFLGLVGGNTNSSRIPLWDVETDDDGKIFAVKMGWFASSDKAEIYTWDNNGNDAKRDTVIEWAPDQEKYRLGDDFTVDGSFKDSTLKIYMAHSLNDPTCNQIYVWDMSKGIDDIPDDTTIVENLENDFMGLQVDIWPLGGVNTDSVLIAGGTQRVHKVYLSTGSSKVLNKPPTYDYGNGLCAFRLGNDKYFALTANFNPERDNEQNLQIINYTNGLENVAEISHETERLGPNTRNQDFLPNNSDVDVAVIEEGSIDIFVLQTDNGFARYRFQQIPAHPRIVSISDVPDDQGGEVRIKFKRSKFDGLDDSQKIVSYTIWREIGNNEWDGINSFNAVQDSVYNTTVPTLGDSTVNGIKWSSYKISAHTQEPDIFYYSEVDSGYSIDNIAPGVPEGLEIQSTQDHIMLTWEGNKEEDLQYYAVYRSQQAGFNPDTMSSYTYALSDTVLTDNDMSTNTTYYYKVSAIDHAGNESEFSESISTTFTGIENKIEKPTEFSLSQNYPNPFNPVTSIEYSLKKDCQVEISIYDINGKQVETLLKDNKSAGSHKVTWNADGIPTGVYFYKIHAGSFTDVKKCILIQ
jgi:hypothetical protein